MAKAKRHYADPEVLLKYSHEKLSSSSQNPPSGYTFVPKGNVYITRHCRLLTDEAGKTLWVVHHPVNNVRLGLHVPTDIVAQVQANEAVTADYRKNVVANKDGKDLDKARGVLLKLYPRVPLESAELILSHGYLKGSGRVGRTSTLDDEEKMKLATAAHIRHKLTNYESLLRERRKEARRHGHNNENVRDEVRKQISQDVQRIIKSWSPAKNTAAQLSTPQTSSIKRKAKGSLSSLEEVKDREWELSRMVLRSSRKQRKRASRRTDQHHRELASETTTGSTSEVAVNSTEALPTDSAEQKLQLSRPRSRSRLHSTQPGHKLSKDQKTHTKNANQRYAYNQEDWIDDGYASTALKDSDSDSSASNDHLSDDKAPDDTIIHRKELEAIQETSRRLGPQYTASPARVTRQSLRNGIANSTATNVAGAVVKDKERRISTVREDLEAYETTRRLVGAKRRLNIPVYRSAGAVQAALTHQHVVSATELQSAEKVQKAARRGEKDVRRANRAARFFGKRNRAVKAEPKVKQERDQVDFAMLYEKAVSKRKTSGAHLGLQSAARRGES
ncbi:MAG: hypothetical protein M1835_003719 [Candelina submexicana]|nr:MAG: hypothetical protein M1835_003719 [Candelina submexicana]